VVGVSENILNWDISDRPQPTAYVPYPHVPDRDPLVLLRTVSDPAVAAQAARAAVNEAAPGTPVLGVLTMTEVHHMALERNQTLASLFAALGGIALLLGAIGVYGVLSYFVTERTVEIGIRAALGADARSLVRMFVRQGLAAAAIGLALGLPAAWAVARVLRGRLYNISPPDPLIFSAVTLLLLLAAFTAAYVPARRAAAVDPLVALRR
jgi:putative ABC transport system permease protein